MNERTMDEAMKASFITSLGPAFGSFVGMTVLVLALGGAYAFARESAGVGSIMYELIAARAGAEAAGVAGNISNFRLPVSAVAQEVAQVQQGSPEGEVISTLAITATQVMITISALTGALFVSAIVSALPATVVAAFDWLLPSIWGAIVVQFGLRNWRYAVVAVIISIIVVVYSGLPDWTHTMTVVVLMVALALFMCVAVCGCRKPGASTEPP
jgi:hypothetical protein